MSVRQSVRPSVRLCPVYRLLEEQRLAGLPLGARRTGVIGTVTGTVSIVSAHFRFQSQFKVFSSDSCFQYSARCAIGDLDLRPLNSDLRSRLVL